MNWKVRSVLEKLVHDHPKKYSFYKQFNTSQLKDEAVCRNLRLGDVLGGRYSRKEIIFILVENDVFYNGPFGMSNRFMAVKKGLIKRPEYYERLVYENEWKEKLPE